MTRWYHSFSFKHHSIEEPDIHVKVFIDRLGWGLGKTNKDTKRKTHERSGSFVSVPKTHRHTSKKGVTNHDIKSYVTSGPELMTSSLETYLYLGVPI